MCYAFGAEIGDRELGHIRSTVVLTTNGENERKILLP